MVKRLKIFIAAITAVVMLCTSVCTAHAAGSYFQKDGFFFGIKNDEAYIHGTDGTGWDIVIPEMFLDFFVTEIEEYAFYENQSIEVLSFYEASQLARLGDGAFAHCRKLKKVHITESIQELGVGVFEDCTALSYVRFRDGSASEVPAQSFYGCGALTNVVFDNGITSIGNLAFANCSSLTRLEIPETVTSIADNAFDGCDNLVIRCHYDSFAQHYAQEHNINYSLMDLSFVLGDADNSGSVNINDVTMIQKVISGKKSDTDGLIKIRSDVNSDNSLVIRDATLIQMYIAGMDNRFDIGAAKTVYFD